MSKAVSRIATTVLFDLKVSGAQHVPPRGGALIVSNHQSYLDPVVIAVQLRRPIYYIAKSELFDNWFGGWVMRRFFNSFPVRQGAADVGAIKETISRLHAGHLLNIYPEGARTPDGEIGAMQRGVAVVVRKARVPVVPAVIVGAFDAWPLYCKMWRPRPISVLFGPPIEVADLPSEQILDRIAHTLRAMFHVERAQFEMDHPAAANRRRRLESRLARPLPRTLVCSEVP
jgi:1-acyl-sn-glycerol-3-phosphate acyltransferase